MDPATWIARGVDRLARWRQRGADEPAANRFLEGPFAPVQEEQTVTALTVRGEIPAALNGVLAQIGPNPVAVQDEAKHHWFVGDGMVHGVRLRDGQALWYRNRWVLSDNTARALQRDALPGPRYGLPMSVNTNIIGHAGELWALVEAGSLPVALDPELNSRRYGLFNSDQRAAFTAHPHRDPHSGELHSVCYFALNPFRAHYQVVDAAGQLIKRVPIVVRHGPMMHDCALTASQVVVLDLPVTFSLKAAMQGATLPYQWNPRHPARVGLLPRDGGAGDIRWLTVSPCYVFHTCNAYDEPDGSVVLYVVAHQRMFDGGLQGPDAGAITFERWRLPAAGDQVLREVISDLPQEFPRFDERRATKPCRYAYTLGVDPDTLTGQALYRHDLHSGELLRQDYGGQQVFGEMTFVPRRAEGAEEEGWLLVYSYDPARHTSAVLIFNADDFAGEPQAVIELPLRVPQGFHCNWVAM